MRPTSGLTFPAIVDRRLLAGVALLFLSFAACSDDAGTTAGSRPECQQQPRTGFNRQETDEGPCVLESSSGNGQSWTLDASWDREPGEGSSGDGPCIDMQVSTGQGAGWCDLPEARLIGEWVSGPLNSMTRIAWGPVSAGRIARVRVDFVQGPHVEVTPKQTPWDEFDYWFVTFATDRRPVALIALDRQGVEVAREDLSGIPG
jgi:hypothetical protein